MNICRCDDLAYGKRYVDFGCGTFGSCISCEVDMGRAGMDP